MPSTPSPREFAHYFASIGRFAASRGAREAEDLAAQAELSDGVGARLGLPPGLELEWLGTAGFRLTYAGQSLLIDPYLSRVPLGDVVKSRRVVVEPGRYAKVLDPHVGEVVGVIAGHTHFDHAIDVPALAARYDAPVYGSRSAVQLMRAHGDAARAVDVELRRAYELGPFRVTFYPSLHSKLILGLAVPSDGELTCEHLEGLTPSAYPARRRRSFPGATQPVGLAPSAYKCGEVYGVHIEVAGFTVYHQGSANLIDDAVPTGGVDLMLAGIAGRGFTRDYWSRILRLLQPRVVVATHFDDFFRPLDGDQGMSLNVRLAAVPDEIARVSRDIDVVALRPLEPVRG